MSVRCSLLGHDYGETETEREREEQGSEVVVTVREFEECQRCGERKIVSENKEVTSIESPAPDRGSRKADPAADSASADSAPATDGNPGVATRTGANATPDADTAPDANAGTGTGGMGVPDEAVPAGGDDAEILGESTDADRSGGDAASGGPTGDTSSGSPTGDTQSGGSAGDTRSGGSAGGVETEDDAPASGVGSDLEESAPDDDAEILDADASDEGDEHAPREWPEAETTHPAEADEKGPGDWPSVGQDDEGFDAEPDDGERTDVEFGGGLAPESAPEVDDDETDEVEFVNASGDTLKASDAGGADTGGRNVGGANAGGRNAGGADTGRRDTEFSSGISAGAEAPSVSGPSDDPDLDAEFICPECDYREEVSGSSLRAGDICPECGRGYLAQE